MKRSRHAVDDRVVDRVREAAHPLFVADFSAPALRQLADSACLPLASSSASTLVVTTIGDVIAVSEADLPSLLAESVADCETRMELASHSIGERMDDASSPTSVFDLVQIVSEEVRAVGLQGQRHGVRLALEAVLARDVPDRTKALAAAIQREAMSRKSSDGGGDEHPAVVVSSLLQLLSSEGLMPQALNVMSVLAFADVIAESAILRWEEHEQRSRQRPEALALLQPLLQWVRRPTAPPPTEVSLDSEAGLDCEAGLDSLASAAPGGGERGEEAAACDEEAAACDEEAAEGSSSSSSSSVAIDPLCRPVTIDADGEGSTEGSTAGSRGWDPSKVSLALNVQLSSQGEAVVVLDGLVTDELRAELLAVLLGESGEAPSGKGGPARPCSRPPTTRWERTTCDGAGLPLSWGLKPSLLRKLERQPPPCVVAVQSRLARLYPEYTIAHMPPIGSGELDRPPGAAPADEGNEGGAAAGAAQYTATSFVANAATYGSAFQWHVDADPSSLPPSAWLRRHGDYANGEAGKPLFVSLLVYLDPVWRRDWDAETLFLAEGPGVGVLVQPRPGRCVLMHQEVLHRVSTPSLTARRPRFSLVWKLVFFPRAQPQGQGQGQGQREAEAEPEDAEQPHRRRAETICRAEWGVPARVGC